MNVLARAVNFGVGPQHSVDFRIALTAQQQAIVASDAASDEPGRLQCGIEGFGFGTASDISGFAPTSVTFGPIQINPIATPY